MHACMEAMVIRWALLKAAGLQDWIEHRDSAEVVLIYGFTTSWFLVPCW